MKKTTLRLIDFYQKFLSLVFKNILGVPYICKFTPSCSEYAKQAIKKEGFFPGSLLSLKRILKCQSLIKIKNEYA